MRGKGRGCRWDGRLYVADSTYGVASRARDASDGRLIQQSMQAKSGQSMPVSR